MTAATTLGGKVCCCCSLMCVGCRTQKQQKVPPTKNNINKINKIVDLQDSIRIPFLTLFCMFVPHLQTQFWHCNMLIGNCDINMSFLSQNFRVFARAMSFVPELCSSSQNTSHTYVSTCHINVLTSINYGKSQLIISKTQSSDALNGFCNKMNSSLDSSSRTLSGLPELCL